MRVQPASTAWEQFAQLTCTQGYPGRRAESMSFMAICKVNDVTSPQVRQFASDIRAGAMVRHTAIGTGRQNLTGLMIGYLLRML